MTNDEYMIGIRTLHAIRVSLAGLPLADMLQAAEVADTMAPMLDPTAHRSRGKLLAQDIEVMRALLPAWKLLRSEDKPCP